MLRSDWDRHWSEQPTGQNRLGVHDGIEVLLRSAVNSFTRDHRPSCSPAEARLQWNATLISSLHGRSDPEIDFHVESSFERRGASLPTAYYHAGAVFGRGTQ